MPQQQPEQQPQQTEVVKSDYSKESEAMQERTDYTKEEKEEAGVRVAASIFSFFQ